MKIGLDLHEVITADPEFFSEFTRLLKINDHDVHVITGSPANPELHKQLNGYGIYYDGISSITTYHILAGTPSLNINNEGQHWLHEQTWDETKAKLCAILHIDFHIDDSAVYGNYFAPRNHYIKYEGYRADVNQYVFKGNQLKFKFGVVDALGLYTILLTEYKHQTGGYSQ